MKVHVDWRKNMKRLDEYHEWKKGSARRECPAL